jgi:hypothetical protein
VEEVEGGKVVDGHVLEGKIVAGEVEGFSELKEKLKAEEEEQFLPWGEMLRKVRRKIFGKQEVEGKEKTLLQMRGASWIPDKDWGPKGRTSRRKRTFKGQRRSERGLYLNCEPFRPLGKRTWGCKVKNAMKGL